MRNFSEDSENIFGKGKNFYLTMTPQNYPQMTGNNLVQANRSEFGSYLAELFQRLVSKKKVLNKKSCTVKSPSADIRLHSWFSCCRSNVIYSALWWPCREKLVASESPLPRLPKLPNKTFSPPPLFHLRQTLFRVARAWVHTYTPAASLSLAFLSLLCYYSHGANSSYEHIQKSSLVAQ